MVKWLLILGTGKSGIMKVPQRLQTKLQELGIEVVIATTDDAVEIFNRRYDTDDQKAAAGFHLTC
ncbi:MTH938/NDUFAF3 family protein [Acetohalobium arabaticum]|nr:MTH938/NDUFAF3 family protein [Acetohalobium arabaticum]